MLFAIAGSPRLDTHGNIDNRHNPAVHFLLYHLNRISDLMRIVFNMPQARLRSQLKRQPHHLVVHVDDFTTLCKRRSSKQALKLYP